MAQLGEDLTTVLDADISPLASAMIRAQQHVEGYKDAVENKLGEANRSWAVHSATVGATAQSDMDTMKELRQDMDNVAEGINTSPSVNQLKKMRAETQQVSGRLKQHHENAEITTEDYQKLARENQAYTDTIDESLRKSQQEQKQMRNASELMERRKKSFQEINEFEKDVSGRRITRLKEEQKQLATYAKEQRKMRDAGVIDDREAKRRIGIVRNLHDARTKEIKQQEDATKSWKKYRGQLRDAVKEKKRIAAFTADETNLRQKNISTLQEEQAQLQKRLQANRKLREQGILDPKRYEARNKQIRRGIDLHKQEVATIEDRNKRAGELRGLRKQMRGERWQLGGTTEELQQQRKEVERLQSTMHRYKKAIPDRQYKQWSRQLHTLNKRIDVNNKRLTGQAGVLDRVFRKYNSLVGATTRQIHLYGILGAVVGAVTVAYAGLGAMAVRETAKLEEAANRLGMTIEKLQKFEFALGMVGLTSRDTRDALSDLSSKMYDAATGTKSAQEAFQELGIGMKTLSEESGNTAKMFRMVMTELSKIDNISRRQGVADQIFGESAAARIAAVSGGFKEFTGIAEELGLTIDEKVAQKANKAWKVMTSLWNVLKSKFMKAAADAAGALERIAAEFITVLNTTNVFKDTIVPTINTTIDLFKALFTVIKPLVKLLQVALSHLRATLSVLASIAGLVVGGKIIGPILVALPNLIGGLKSAVAWMGALRASTITTADAFFALKMAASSVFTATGIGAITAIGAGIGAWFLTKKQAEDTKARIDDTTKNVTENLDKVVEAQQEAESALDSEMELKINSDDAETTIQRLKEMTGLADQLAVEKAFDKIKETFGGEAARKMRGNRWQDIETTLSTPEIRERDISDVSDVMKTLNELPPELAKGVKSSVSSAQEAIRDLDFEEAAKTLNNAASKALATGAQDAEVPWEESKKAAGTLEALGSVIAALSGKAEETQKEIEKQVEKRREQTVKAWATLAEGLGKKAQNLTNPMVESLQSVRDEYNPLIHAFDKTQKKLKALKEESGKDDILPDGLLDSISNWLSKLRGLRDEELKEERESIRQSVNEMLDPVKEAANEAAEPYNEQLDTLRNLMEIRKENEKSTEGLEKKEKRLIEARKEAVEEAKRQALIDPFSDMIDTMGETISDEKKRQSRINEQIEKIEDMSAKELEAVAEELRSKGAVVLDEAGEGLREALKERVKEAEKAKKEEKETERDTLEPPSATEVGSQEALRYRAEMQLRSGGPGGPEQKTAKNTEKTAKNTEAMGMSLLEIAEKFPNLSIAEIVN